MKILLPKNRITITDFIVIGAVTVIIALSLIFIFSPNKSDKIEVITSNKTEIYSLNKNATYSINSNGFSYTIEISDSEAKITEADCPDKTCSHMLPVGKKAGSIICIPGKLVIKTTEKRGANDEADIVIP